MKTHAAFKTGSLLLLAVTFALSGWSTRASAQLPARVFTLGANNEIHFASGSSQWCVYVEAINNNFNVTDIDQCSVTLSSDGTGSVSEISFDCAKGAIIRDADSNGIQDIMFCWLKTDMHPLFDQLHGRQPKTVTLTVRGNLSTGGSFYGSVTLQLYLMD